MANVVGATAGAVKGVTPWGAIAMGAGAALGLGQSIWAGAQQKKYTKKFLKGFENRPIYEIPSEYKTMLERLRREAATTEPAWANIQKEQIGQATAKGTQLAERGAISSTGYQGAISDILDKELKALQDLGIQSMQYQEQKKQDLMQGEKLMGEQKAEQWNINEYVPWQTKMNFYGEKAGAAGQNLWAGMRGITDSFSNFAGTKAYIDAIKKMYPQGVPPTNPTLGTPSNTVGFNPYKVDITYPDSPVDLNKPYK